MAIRTIPSLLCLDLLFENAFWLRGTKRKHEQKKKQNKKKRAGNREKIYVPAAADMIVDVGEKSGGRVVEWDSTGGRPC